MRLAGWWLLPGLLFLGGIVFGIAASLWWARREAKARRRIPKHWPLDPRMMVNAEEGKVWRWLIRVFFDRYVMIKVPVTRFTIPSAGENSAHWYQLLSGVYCTFTVCGADGQVVGCVDVPGPRGISRSNRRLKQALLSQCGIGYWIVTASHLPTLEEIRADFLGTDERSPGEKIQKEMAVARARLELHAAVDRQRHKRASAASAAVSEGPSSEGDLESHPVADSGFAPSAWQQPNSFIAPLDTRRALR